MRTWRNWQTRWFQVPVKQFMWVQVPSSAPSKNNSGLSRVVFAFLRRGLKGKRYRADFRWTSATVEDRARSSRENQVPSSAPKKYCRKGYIFCSIFLSKSQTWYIIECITRLWRDIHSYIITEGVFLCDLMICHSSSG